jgi:toxin ParE1/3/4
MKLIVSEEAIADLTSVWAYISQDSVEAADAFVNRLYQRCVQLKELPSIGRRRDELLPGLRSVPEGRYLIFYRLLPERVEIVRILSAYRDVESLL